MSEIRVKELRVGKGVTTQKGENEWRKSYYELTLDTHGLDPKEVEINRETAELYLNKLLGMAGVPKPTNSPHLTREVSKVPNFNPEDLMQHEWKNKKQPDGTYTKGSLNWGWDFADKFPKEILACLPLTIDHYRFTLSDNKKLVNVQKAKP